MEIKKFQLWVSFASIQATAINERLGWLSLRPSGKEKKVLFCS